jgi:hypothetical protein
VTKASRSREERGREGKEGERKGGEGKKKQTKILSKLTLSCCQSF